jgi:MFS family permease
MKKWSVAILLAVGQFVMVLDSTVMNVSISQLVIDLDTTVVSLQAAITFYTLTMAALMLTGAKLCAKMGLLKAFVLGSVIYGIGSLATGLSQNFTQLFIGWSIIEGIGAVLVIPAIAALIASNYEGKDRAAAFALIGAVSGAGAAIGPLIGGFMTTYASWRYVFIAETVVIIVLLLASRTFKSVPGDSKATLNIPSVFLSVFGMTFLVFGILQSKTWGFVRPLGAPEINGNEITPLGISLVMYLIIGGIILLKVFYDYQLKLIQREESPLLDVRLFNIDHLRAGLSVLLSQYFIIAGVFFIIPVYLQIALGFDALETGIKMMPLSIALILGSAVGTRLAAKFSSKRIVIAAQVILVVGTALFAGSLKPELTGYMFGSSLFVIGLGLGLLASRLGDINMSSVSEKETSQVGGLQGTFQNLGSSLGLALIGSVLVMSLTTGFVSELKSNEVPASIVSYVEENTKAGVAIVSPSEVEDYAISQGLSESEATSVSESYRDAQFAGLKEAAAFLVGFAALSLLFSRNIPSKKPQQKVAAQ